MDLNPSFFLMNLLAFIIGVTLHEFGHAYAADRLGDETPRRQQRISINPMDHLDPIGTVGFVLSSLLGLGFGWGKAVQTRPSSFKNPRYDSMVVSLAGPFMNLLLAIAFAMIVRYGTNSLPASSPYFQLLCKMVEVNVLLFVFNLLPIPPLDGSKVVAALLPDKPSRAYETVMGQWGFMLFFVLLLAGGRFLGPVVDHLANEMSNTITIPAILFPMAARY